MDEPLEVFQEIAEVFASLGIGYMIVGSMAMRAYVPARSTYDTDVLVKMSQEQLDGLLAKFGEDWYLDPETARKNLAAARMFNAIHYGTSWKLDMIPLKDDEYHRVEFGRRRREKINDVECLVQSPEDLVLSKLLWAARGGSQRQIEDVESLLRAGLSLDDSYMSEWAERLGVSRSLSEARDA